MKKLTIGIATHDDYEGLYFSIQAIRMYHKEILNDIEFIIIDNNPESKHGECIRHLLNWVSEPVQYLPFKKYQSTTVRNKIFELADTPYVLSIDSHVFIEPTALKKLIKFYDDGKDSGCLVQGPLIYDDLKSVSTHFDLSKWGGYMWGQWGTDERGVNPKGEAFEIEAQGLGLFSCRKDSWLGFNKMFRGFGGEEGYIHEKYRKHGRKTLCLPSLRWMHRFERPNGVNYPNNLADRFRNYYIGFKELGLDATPLLEQFKDYATPELIDRIEDEINAF